MDATAVAIAELRHLDAQRQRMERGALSPELFRRVRLQYGVYGLRNDPDRYMVRVRVPLGIITADQLDALAEACATFTPQRRCHLTTRQDVQLYGVPRAQVCAMLRRLAEAGLTTREASGNAVRNITCCPWAGVAREEPFDITPHALAVHRYFLRNPLTQLLPRKIKIAFEGCPIDHARTAIHDIGVAAALQDVLPGFRVYVGGGLGPAPRSAQLLEPWTSPEWLLPTIEAVLRVFDRCGERAGPARARLKFLVERLGWEEFQRRVLQERELVWATRAGQSLLPPPEAEEPLPLPRAAQRLPSLPPLAFARWGATNVVSQKQAGVAGVTVRVPCGDLSVDQLRAVARAARRYAGGVRLTNTQNLVLRHVRYGSLWPLYHALAQAGLARGGAGRLADVTRCPGADSCLSAITRPRGLAQALEALCLDGLSAAADAAIAVKISGCPNACGQHHIADIGCFGVAVKSGDRHLPCYQLLVGGGTQEGRATFGQRVIRVPARRAPEAIARLVRGYVEQRYDQEPFAAYVARVGLPHLQRSLEALADVTAADAPDLWKDLGSEEPFTLGAGKGECAA